MGEKLNNAAQLESLQSDYFVRMMLPDAEEKAQPYVAEERRSLSRLIGSIGDIARRNFVVIGSGTIWYIELAYLKTRKYIAVEPLAEIFLPQQIRFVLGQHKNVRIIDKEFGGFRSAIWKTLIRSSSSTSTSFRTFRIRLGKSISISKRVTFSISPHGTGRKRRDGRVRNISILSTRE